MKNSKLYDAWIQAKLDLDRGKALELKLRQEVVKEIAEETPGTYHREHGEGQLVATVKHNYKLDLGALEKIWNNLSPAEKSCIESKPTLKLKQYKALDPRRKIHKAIIETPATPTLKFKEKK